MGKRNHAIGLCRGDAIADPLRERDLLAVGVRARVFSYLGGSDIVVVEMEPAAIDRLINQLYEAGPDFDYDYDDEAWEEGYETALAAVRALASLGGDAA